MPLDTTPWIYTFVAAWFVGVLVFVGTIGYQAVKFYRQPRVDRSTGNVVPFRQEH